MKQISNYYLRKLAQRDSLVFLEKISEHILRITDEKFQPSLNTFTKAVNIYREALLQTSQSMLAMQIASEEKHSHSVWSTIRELADGLMAHYGQTSRDTGFKIHAILNEAGGYPASLSAAGLTDLLALVTSRLENEIPHETLKRAGIFDWLMELKRSLKRLVKLGKDQYFEINNVNVITRTNDRSRKEAEKAYYATVRFINAMSIYHDDPQCHEVIYRINMLIEQAKAGTLASSPPQTTQE
ncbi:MAG: hypothetical protein LBC81_04615 [Tannerellaceae bacterium]|jgi:hypothetical protein|nr:hypothetical protein [Tannerellaceae bacterium]